MDGLYGLSSSADWLIVEPLLIYFRVSMRLVELWVKALQKL